jgi:hypothetical protein
MADQSNKNLAFEEPKGVSEEALSGFINLAEDFVMFNDPAIKAAKDFGRRLRDGEVTILDPEESNREFDADLEAMKNTLHDLQQLQQKGPRP